MLFLDLVLPFSVLFSLSKPLCAEVSKDEIETPRFSQAVTESWGLALPRQAAQVWMWESAVFLGF